MQVEPTLWIGHPFAIDANVSGAAIGDAFAISIARTATGAPVDLAWTGPADPDGWLKVRFAGAEVEHLQPGTYKAELAMRRGAMSGILGTLLIFAVQRALIPPIAEAPRPLVNSLGKLLRITISEQPPFPVQLVAGIKGSDGGTGGIDAFEFSQPSPAMQWTIAHNLGRRPIVTTLSVGGMPMEGSIAHLSPDVLIVSFLIPVAGTAHLV